MSHTRLLKLIWASCAALTVTMLCLAAGLFWRTVARPAFSPPPAQRVVRIPRLAAFGSESAPSLRPGDYGETWRLPIVPVMQPEEPTPGSRDPEWVGAELLAIKLATELDVRLCVVEHAAGALRAFASVVDRAGGLNRTRVMQVGDEIRGFRVVAITPESVEFERGGVRASLSHSGAR